MEPKIGVVGAECVCCSNDDEGNYVVSSSARGERTAALQQGFSAGSFAPSLLVLSTMAVSTLSLTEGVSITNNQNTSNNTTPATSVTRGITGVYTGVNSREYALNVGLGVVWSVAFLLLVLAAVVSLRECRARSAGNEEEDAADDPQEDNAQQVMPDDHAPNGRAVVGHRDPGDHQGEIIELREVQWGWGYIPGEVVPMVIMGAAPEVVAEEEEEDAV
ncbi:hypothetical protein [Candidatus Ichthyocystis sparus]|uniref:hypothetical protein n=1 Tax=Candidatus Ichthyocystis sparus TaxID=1561004 RepID=UPI000B895FBF|nr:hypothetical protein [Candidatus Ichthyocystis sparus]